MIEALKGFFTIFSGLLILPALAMEPGQVAIDFLEKVREGKVDLKVGGDTALSPHITDQKRKLIEKSIQQLSSQIGKGKLVLSETRQEGDFAAVMVTQGGDSDQIKLQVYPVALVRGESGWRAAPILASYENAVSAYTVPLRKQLSGLESWMMQQRVLEIQRLISSSAQRLRDQIKTHFKEGDLAGSDLVRILNQFQKAYREDRQAEVLGYIGGYSEQWPADWESRLESMQVAFSDKARENYPWKLLASPDVIRVVVGEDVDETRGVISLACLDPTWVGDTRSMEKTHVIHFNFAKDSGGNWRLDLPDSFLQHDADAFFEGQGMDEELLDRFAKRLRLASPERVSDRFEQAEEQVIGQLESGRLSELLRWVDFGGSPAKSRAACEAAASEWWRIQAPGLFRTPVKLAERVEGDWAVAIYYWFSLNQGERFEYKPMFFRKSKKGWIWVPGEVRDLQAEHKKSFSEWMKLKEEQWRLSAAKKILEPVLLLDEIALLEVKDEDVRKLAEKWIAALSEKDIRGLFAMSARLGGTGPVSHKVFRNLAYELAMAQRAETEFTGIYRKGKWVAAGISHGQGDAKVFSFLPIVPTAEGVRILTEIDLISDDSRTRKFLNRVSFDRLRSFVSNEDLEVVKGLFETFEKDSR
jgi:hypothetical protein